MLSGALYWPDEGTSAIADFLFYEWGAVDLESRQPLVSLENHPATVSPWELINCPCHGWTFDQSDWLDSRFEIW